jgi:hypothetical protein
MARGLLLATTALVALACATEERVPAPGAAPAPGPPVREARPPLAPPEAAKVEAPAYPEPPKGAITGVSSSGGIAAWTVDRTAARVQPVSPGGSPRGAPRDVPLTAAHRLHSVYPVGGGFVLASHDLCPDRKYFYKCLFLRLLSASGEPLGDEVVTTTREWIREELVARGEGTTAVLTSHMYIPPALLVLSVDPAGALRAAQGALDVDGDLIAGVELVAAAGGYEVLLRSEVDDPRRLIYARADAGGAIVEGPKRLAPGRRRP